MERLEIEHFEPHTGTTYTFSREWEGATISAELRLTQLEAYELNKRDRRAKDTSGKYRSKPFSAIFEGAHPTPLPQGNYRVTHPSAAEPMDIFISCRGPNDDETEFMYEAVFG